MSVTETIQPNVDHLDPGQQKKDFHIFGPFNKEWTQDEAVEKLLALEAEVYKGIKVRFESKRAIQMIQEDIKDGQAMEIFSNHQSHYDGRAIQKTLEKLLPVLNTDLTPENQYKGAVAPIAVSIETGDQDYMLQQFLLKMKGMLEKGCFHAVNFTREKDEFQYELEQTRDSMTEFNNEINSNLDLDRILTGFLEGTVQGGRRDSEGNVYGMQPFEEKSMRRMKRFLEKRGKGVSIIPIGISGTYKVLAPDEGYRPPGLTILKAKLSQVTKGFVNLTGIVNVTIGEPIRWDLIDKTLEFDGLKGNDVTRNAFVGNEIASLLPVAERGIYRAPFPEVIKFHEDFYAEKRRQKTSDPRDNETQ